MTTPILSRARLAALRRLHASRRGVPVNDSGLTPAELRKLRSRLREVIYPPHLHRYDPRKPSARDLARECGVSDRTVRRWIGGEDVPPREAVQRIRAWLRRQDTEVRQ